MVEEQKCPECGTKLPAHAPEGMCPKCLLAGGLAETGGIDDATVLDTDFAGDELSDGRDQLDVRAVDDSELPEKISGYRIIRLIGVGGMGVVYEAQQPTPRRTVALKVIRSHLATRQVLRRFAHEAEALGRLQHPGIAQVYESGTADSSRGRRPFFAMELICGPDGSEAPTLTEYADREQLGTQQRLELLARVANAVHYAHQKGIIHRDLKPANILVDETGQPKILDFGVARITDSDIQATTMQTDIGQIIGTLPYMSPEQAGGDPDELDTRSDVYALGVIAYELLAGHLPYELERRLIHEAVRIIREETPTRLSAINRTLRGDVETIVAKALAKEPQRRYQSAAELSADIRRYLDDEPIAARPPSAWYQLGKFAKRNKALVGGAAAVLVVLILGIIGTSMGLIEARRAQGLAEGRREEAETARQAETAQRQVAEDRELTSRRHLYAAHLNLIGEAWREADIGRVRELLAYHVPQAGQGDLRGFEWYYFQRLCNRDLRTLRAHTSPITDVAFSPNGTVIASASWDDTIKLCDAATGKQLAILKHATTPHAIAFRPDGKVLAVGEGGRGSGGRTTSELVLWDTVTGDKLSTFKLPFGVKSLAFSPDGKTLAAGTFGGVRLLDAASGKQRRTLAGASWSVNAVAFSPDNALLAAMGRVDGAVTVWEAASGKIVRNLPGHSSQLHAIAFSPDGKLLAAGAQYEAVRLWDTSTWKLRTTLKGEQVRSIAFSPDGGTLASAAKTIELWDIATGARKLTLKGHAPPVHAVAFSPNGSVLASGDSEGSVKLWDPQHQAYTQVAGAWRGFCRAVSPDARTLAVLDSGDSSSTVRRGDLLLVDAATGKSGATLKLGFTGRLPGDPVFSPDSSKIATISYADGRAALSPPAAVLSPPSRSGVKVWDVATGRELCVLERRAGAVVSMAFSPDGGTLATGTFRGVVKLWDTRRGRETGTIPTLLRGLEVIRRNPDGSVVSKSPASVEAMAFSPTGRLLATAMSTVKLWNAASRKQAVVLTGPPCRHAKALAFSPDGKILAATGRRGRIRLWDTATGRELIFGGKGLVGAGASLAFSPDGRRLVSGGQLWDVATGHRLLVIDLKWQLAAFGPDGKTLLLVDAGEARFYHAADSSAGGQRTASEQDIYMTPRK